MSSPQIRWRQRNKERWLEYRRQWRRENRERLSEQQRQTRVAQPEKYAARYALNNALQRGEITREPCEVCGATRSQAHHDDYSKPLEVRWLCHAHHAEHHLKETS